MKKLLAAIAAFTVSISLFSMEEKGKNSEFYKKTYLKEFSCQYKKLELSFKKGSQNQYNPSKNALCSAINEIVDNMDNIDNLYDKTKEKGKQWHKKQEMSEEELKEFKKYLKTSKKDLHGELRSGIKNIIAKLSTVFEINS